jgi:hypothetical protein
LDDREEFGVVVDGQAGEYGLGQPLIEDPQGDSESSEAGTDIKGLYAKTFLNENKAEELYLALSTWDNQYNPDAWYEIFLTTDSDFYQYRFEPGRSSLWHEEGGNMVDISGGRVESQFKDWLEAKIPLDLLGSPDQITMQAFTRASGDPYAPDNADWSLDATYTIGLDIFITGPLNPDTDGDGVSDGVEVQFGSDPTNAADAVWLIYLPIALKIH